MVVAGIFIFGGIIMAGLYLSPHGAAPLAPAGLLWSAPRRQTLRFVCYDLRRQHLANDPAMGEIANLRPDYVLLQGVEEDEAVQAAEFLGMQRSYHPQLLQRSQNLGGRKATYGNLILSRHDLYEGAPLLGPAGAFGAWATSVIDGQKFAVACVYPGPQAVQEMTHLTQTWRDAGAPPTVACLLAGDQLPSGTEPLTATRLGAGGEWLLLTKDWQIAATGAAPGGGAGAAPMWVDVVATPVAPATTHAATRAADLKAK